MGKLLKVGGVALAAFNSIISIYNLTSGKTSGLKGYFEAGLSIVSTITGPYGVAASLGYEVGKLHPLKLIGIDATKWFK